MTREAFLAFLAEDRSLACRLLAVAKAAEWSNVGPGEVARHLARWMENRVNLGDDETLADLWAASNEAEG
jgi:hypothetical protein